ncbi:MAG TPA: glycerol kinase GlpK [Candidatus Angelobacter sp.]|nr:glycerol kinase GlpK [Candidatus Angelobacter sp.]
MPEYIAALDQGTTSTRFIVFDRSGRIVSCAQREHTQHYPQAGWVEHDAQEIWQRTQEVMDDAMGQSRLRRSDIAGIGITNQRETTVLWDRRTGEPIANALVWQDTRVAADVARLGREVGEEFFRSRTGLPLSTYFSALKIRWLLENASGLRGRAERGEVLFGNIDSYLVWHLTGGIHAGLHITDVTNASRTQLMSLHALDWRQELLQTFGIPREVLPEIHSSAEIYGEVKEGPLRGVPIAGILGDQQAALVGQACFVRGEAKNTYGTGCFLLMNTGSTPVPSKHGLLTTVAYKFGDHPACYALEGSVAIAGALVQWLRDNLWLFKNSTEIEDLARSADDNGGVYFVPAFSGLYAPYWNDNARGLIAGLTRYANRSHIARAVLEATAFQTRDVVQAMEKDSGIALEILRVDGGMVVNDLLMQFQADILNREVVRPAMKETTALGAAFAAGLATGFYRSTDELRAAWDADKSWLPAMDEDRRDQICAMWKKAVGRSLDWLE